MASNALVWPTLPSALYLNMAERLTFLPAGYQGIVDRLSVNDCREFGRKCQLIPRPSTARKGDNLTEAFCEACSSITHKAAVLGMAKSTSLNPAPTLDMSPGGFLLYTPPTSFPRPSEPARFVMLNGEKNRFYDIDYATSTRKNANPLLAAMRPIRRRI